MTLLAHKKLLFIGTFLDKPYLQRLKPCIGVVPMSLILDCPSTFTELLAVCKAKGATGVVSTSSTLLGKLVAKERGKPSIDKYAGSLFKMPGFPQYEIVFIDPLEQSVTVPHWQFVTTRYISKLVNPGSWIPTTKFNWEIFNESTFSETLELFKSAEAIAIDIETFSTPPSIRCVGYTGLFYNKATGWSSNSLVIPCDSVFNLSCIRAVNAIPVPKIMQNGKYDISYLQAYNAAPAFYLWDTAEMFHSWYSELPKDLAYLNCFFVRDAMYWKDLANTNDLHQYYLYNAKDTWATANVFLAWIAESPRWAKANYGNTFPLQFPCHLSEMTGIARDADEMNTAQKEAQAVIDADSKSLCTMIATPNFNVNSPIQMKALLVILGCKDLEHADASGLAKAASRHPLNARIIKKILSIRKQRKLISTYITPGKEFHGHLGQYKESRNGRILYSLNPHGTDTGRLASREHHFWCGLQIQNIPRGASVKRTLIADNGFGFGECDLEQAESRDTAYIVGEESLITATTGTRDFHSVNAAAFFGVPYNSIYDDTKRRVIDKALRDLAKRVNHGANYNMGAAVLLDTMGEENIAQARKLLGLPKVWSYMQVAEHLLAVFHKTYPRIKGVYYTGVVHEVGTTHMLSSKATHSVQYQAFPASPLVRYCFGVPSKSKRDLNALVAHCPQSLNAMTLNRAYMKVFYELAIHKDHSANFKLLAQIHDSILFQFRLGHSGLCGEVQRAMEIPVTVKGYDSKVRTFTVPASTKAGIDGLGARRWNEIE